MDDAEMALRIKAERKQYEDVDEVTHNRDLHSQILSTWRSSSPNMVRELEALKILDDMAFVCQERMWRTAELYQKGGDVLHGRPRAGGAGAPDAGTGGSGRQVGAVAGVGTGASDNSVPVTSPAATAAQAQDLHIDDPLAIVRASGLPVAATIAALSRGDVQQLPVRQITKATVSRRFVFASREELAQAIKDSATNEKTLHRSVSPASLNGAPTKARSAGRCWACIFSMTIGNRRSNDRSHRALRDSIFVAVPGLQPFRY
ncbi:MAG: hypothetical protein VW877_02295 [Pseudomonadaceae bacterium]